MTWVLIAAMGMVIATIAVHLGLPQAIGDVVDKVFSCHKCLSFWVILLSLIILDCPLRYTILLSILGGYLSNWFGLGLMWLGKAYDKLWERIRKKRKN